MKPSPFIVITSLDKQEQDQSTRRLIRSHVMRGKNTRADRRARAEAKAAKINSSRAKPDFDSPPTSLSLSSSASEQDSCSDVSVSIPAIIPRKIAPELALERYAFEMKPYMVDLMYRAFNAVKPCVYAVEMKLVNVTEAEMFGLNDLHRHKATLHTILFTSQAFHDLLMGRPPFGKIAQFHLGEALRYLQQSIGDEEQSTALATVAVVITLASAAAALGDLEGTKKHVEGLYQILKLRGDTVMAIEKGSMLEQKAQRVDLSLAMATGREPRLFPRNIPWGLQIAPASFLAQCLEEDVIPPVSDPKIRALWVDFKYYTIAANKARASKTNVAADMFLQLSTAIPNRVMRLEYDVRGFTELVRLTMLAFVKSLLFRVPGLGRTMHYLSDKLQLALQAQRYPPDPDRAKLMFWALFISGLFIFEDFEQPWHRLALAETMAALGITSWFQAKLILSDVLWVDGYYDLMAEAAFRTIIS